MFYFVRIVEKVYRFRHEYNVFVNVGELLSCLTGQRALWIYSRGPNIVA